MASQPFGELEHLPNKCAVTPITTPVTMAGMDKLDQKYRALVGRIDGCPMSETAQARILGEIEATYRRERAAEPTGLPQLDLDPAFLQSR